MKRKGSRLAEEIMQEYNKKKRYEELAKRKKQVGDKNGGTTK